MSPIGTAYDPHPGYDLVQLRYVQAIVGCQSMTAAAKQLRVSQPTLSTVVRELEARLGTSLFLRSARGVVPTPSGLPARPHPDLVLVPLFRDAMAVVCARKQPPRTAPLFHVPRIPPSERVMAALRAQGKLPERVVPCGDLELVKSLVLNGAGIGVLPWRVAMQNTARGALRLLDARLPFDTDVGCLFYRADLHRTRAALLLRDEIVRRGHALDAFALPHGVGRIGRRAAASAAK